jgi:hypothetical protein
MPSKFKSVLSRAMRLLRTLTLASRRAAKLERSLPPMEAGQSESGVSTADSIRSAVSVTAPTTHGSIEANVSEPPGPQKRPAPAGPAKSAPNSQPSGPQRMLVGNIMSPGQLEAIFGNSKTENQPDHSSNMAQARNPAVKKNSKDIDELPSRAVSPEPKLLALKPPRRR